MYLKLEYNMRARKTARLLGATRIGDELVHLIHAFQNNSKFSAPLGCPN